MNNDINITIEDRDGIRHLVSAPIDMSLNLMEVIRLFELVEEGTIGICGGIAMCASCQCYIENNNMVPKANEDEIAMLSEAFHVKGNSRLSCQIPMTKNLEGLKIKIAPEY